MTRTKSALSALLLTSLVAGAATASHAEGGKAKMEKCYGVAKAGQNDCQAGDHRSLPHLLDHRNAPSRKRGTPAAGLIQSQRRLRPTDQAVPEQRARAPRKSE